MPILDAKSLAKITPPARGTVLVHDQHRDAPRGFAVKVHASGSVSFVLRYRFEGAQRELTIGSPPAWKLTSARAEAAAKKALIDAGEDVIDQRRRRRQEIKVKGAAERFLADHADGLRSGPEIRRILLSDFVPSLGGKRLSAVTRADVLEIVKAKRATAPRAAGLLLAHVKSFFSWATHEEMIGADPAAGIKPKKMGLQQNRRARVLSDREIADLWSGLDSVSVTQHVALAIRLVLVLGQRPGEIAGMRWSEIDGEEWVIPGSRRKTNLQHMVPLTPLALDLIGQARAEAERLAKRRKDPDDDAVFPSARTGAPITSQCLAKAVARHAEALGSRDDPDEGHWHVHDLRRTVRTRLSDLGVPRDAAEMTLGHVLSGVEGTYNRASFAREKRIALESWSRSLSAIVGDSDTGGAEIVPITSARGRE